MMQIITILFHILEFSTASERDSNVLPAPPSFITRSRTYERKIEQLLENSKNPAIIAYFHNIVECNEQMENYIENITEHCEAFQSHSTETLKYAEDEIIELIKHESELLKNMNIDKLLIKQKKEITGITRHNICSHKYHYQHPNFSKALFGTGFGDQFGYVVTFYECMFDDIVVDTSDHSIFDTPVLSKFEQFLIFCMYCNRFSRNFIAEVYNYTRQHIGGVISLISPFVGAASKNGYILEHQYRVCGETKPLKNFREFTGHNVTFGADGVVFPTGKSRKSSALGKLMYNKKIDQQGILLTVWSDPNGLITDALSATPGLITEEAQVKHIASILSRTPSRYNVDYDNSVYYPSDWKTIVVNKSESKDQLFEKDDNCWNSVHI